MDKASSVIAAFEAEKLPTTQQLNSFIQWLSDVGITQIEPTADTALSSQGRLIADDLRQVLYAYKQLANNKNGIYSFHPIGTQFWFLLFLKPTTFSRRPSGI